MTREEIDRLRLSDEAPYEHDKFAVWLHNKIIDKVNYEIWSFRENKSAKISSSYVACNHIISLESLKRI